MGSALLEILTEEEFRTLNSTSKLLVLDTNILLNNPDILNELGPNNIVVIPEIVHDELRHQKQGKGDVSYRARRFNNLFKQLSLRSMENGTARSFDDYSGLILTDKNRIVLTQDLPAGYIEKLRLRNEDLSNDKIIVEIAKMLSHEFFGRVEVISDDGDVINYATRRGLVAQLHRDDLKLRQRVDEVVQKHLVYLLQTEDEKFKRSHTSGQVLVDPKIFGRFAEDLSDRRNHFYADSLGIRARPDYLFLNMENHKKSKPQIREDTQIYEKRTLFDEQTGFSVEKYYEMPTIVFDGKEAKSIAKHIRRRGMTEAISKKEALRSIVIVKQKTVTRMYRGEKDGNNVALVEIKPERLTVTREKKVRNSIRTSYEHKHLKSDRYPIEVEENGFLVLRRTNREGKREETILMKRDGAYEPIPARSKIRLGNVIPKNREQAMLMTTLTDNFHYDRPVHRVHAVEGKAGCGKSVIALASALWRQAMKYRTKTKAEIEKESEKVSSDISLLEKIINERKESLETLLYDEISKSNSKIQEVLKAVDTKLGKYLTDYKNFIQITMSDVDLEKRIQFEGCDIELVVPDFDKITDYRVGTKGRPRKTFNNSERKEAYERITEILVQSYIEREILQRERKRNSLARKLDELKIELKNAKIERVEPHKIYVMKPLVTTGSDRELGYMPGGFDQKTDSWQKNFVGLFEEIVEMFGVGEDGILLYNTFDEYKKRGLIEFTTLTELTSRTIHNATIIIDEAQDLPPRDMLDILSRAGSTTSIIITGDDDQIHDYRTAQGSKTTGLSHVINSFERNPELTPFKHLYSHIVLEHVVRSELAHASHSMRPK